MTVRPFQPEQRTPSTRSTGGLLLGLPLIAGLVAMGLAEPEWVLWAVVAVGGLAVVYAFFVHPLFGFAIAQASHVIAIDFGANLTPYKMFSVVSSLTIGRYLIQRRRWLAMPDGYTKGLFAICLCVLFGEIFAEFESSPLIGLELGATVLVYLLAAQLIEVTEDAWVLAKVFTCNLLFVTLTVVRETNWTVLDTVQTRASGIIGQPNVLATFAASMLPMAMALVLRRGEMPLWRLVGVAGLAGGTYIQWAAASRGGTTAALAGVLFYAAIVGRGVASRVLLIAAVLGMIVTATNYAPKSFNRVTDSVQLGDNAKEVDTSERGDHVRMGMEMAPRHPWLGHGFSGWGRERGKRTGWLGTVLHSAFVSVAVAYGVLAAGLYIILQVGGVFYALRTAGFGPSREITLAFAAASLSASVGAVTSDTLFRMESWLMVSMCYVLAKRHKDGHEAG